MATRPVLVDTFLSGPAANITIAGRSPPARLKILVEDREAFLSLRAEKTNTASVYPHVFMSFISCRQSFVLPPGPRHPSQLRPLVH